MLQNEMGISRNNIRGLRIRLSSPDQIYKQSGGIEPSWEARKEKRKRDEWLRASGNERGLSQDRGEVKKPETINYRSLKPEIDGLFCERIFGPTKNYECACGKYKRASAYGGKLPEVDVCDVCGVPIADSRVRRERMGRIELNAPVAHIWYLRGIPSRLSLLLGTTAKELERVIYFAPDRRRDRVYRVTKQGRGHRMVGENLSASEEKIRRFYDPTFEAEELWQVVFVDEFPEQEGAIITEQRYQELNLRFGHAEFEAEPLFELAEVTGSDALVVESDVNGREASRAKRDKEVLYKVTRVDSLPFKKGDLITSSDYDNYSRRFVNRFQAIEEAQVIEEPCYIIIKHGNSCFQDYEIIAESLSDACLDYDPDFKVGIGGEAVREILENINISELVIRLREEVSETAGQKKRKLVKRLQVVTDFDQSDSRPEWMIMEVLPVIPPDLRPMVQLDGGRFATSDMNELYRRVINRNNRLERLKYSPAPEIMIRNEKRMLQEAVDALIDNGRRSRVVMGTGNRPLKSLTDLLRGKKGRFRQNLLGKRVDYSGRSVIIIGPHLKIYQCGLPKQMALELFKPFVINKLVYGPNPIAPNVKSAKHIIDKGESQVWAILEEIVKDHPVMLNRAPTLHRLGIQAFEPVLIEGKAMRLHPLVCTAFNADFDGDQMAIHVPLSIEAQTEARVLMLSSNNLLSPASGKPITTPTQDIILGSYFLTTMDDTVHGARRVEDDTNTLEKLVFSSAEDALAAFDHEIIAIQEPIYLRKEPTWECETVTEVNGHSVAPDKWILTTVGRVIFNEALHENFRFKNMQIGKKQMGALLDEAYDKVGQTGMVEMLDALKTLGYHWSTVSGVSLGVGDIIIPEAKQEILSKTLVEEEQLSNHYDMGIMTENEYMRQKDILWADAGKKISDAIINNPDMSSNNALRIMVDSGARGSAGQIAQMAGIRGLMADPSGKIIRYPITANFKEGLNTLEYFISTHGARKGLADTALRTAKSGYLTRRLVDVAQDLIITEEDCDTMNGVEIKPLTQQDGKIVIPLSERITGRISAHDVLHPNGEGLILTRNEEISSAKAKEVEAAGVDSVWVRSPLTCACKNGICRACYGRDLATRKRVAKGEAVGVVAAQSIGEPGTQLTMRTFHTGGVRQFTGEDITQGLPRIEQLFEVRVPKKVAFIAPDTGIVTDIKETDGGKRRLVVEVTAEDGSTSKVEYKLVSSQNLLAEIVPGVKITKGQVLTEGYKSPQQVLDVLGLEEVQHYLLDSIQEVYRSQGVSINDKHVETILRKVAPVNRVRVINEGDSHFVAGELAWKDVVEEECALLDKKNEDTLAETNKFLAQFKSVKNNDKGNDFAVTDENLPFVLKVENEISDLIAEDEKGLVDITVGSGRFRVKCEGSLLTEDCKLGDTVLPAGTILNATNLYEITKNGPQVISLFDNVKLMRCKDVKYVAEDVEIDDKVVIKKDSLVTDSVIKTVKSKGLPSLRLWKVTETLNLTKGIDHVMIEYYFGKKIENAMNSNYEYIEDCPQAFNAKLISDLKEGRILGITTSDGEVVSKESIIRRFLKDRAYGKVLLNGFTTIQGEEIKAGAELNDDVIDEIAKACPDTITVRAASSQSEKFEFMSRVSFLRRLMEKPESTPVVLGVTKAALATESFLSAASFQQTAQVLAGGAVRGDIDHLQGLKENVITGLLIPAGTGIARNFDIKVEEKTEEKTEPVDIEANN
ncbi:MAG: DNA-directed RNA polymerase subunit beta' [Synergistaceae bacterium]|nr:DNA-directed RNA polymerase subunit beta' [Synergistaceae bacterium]